MKLKIAVGKYALFVMFPQKKKAFCKLLPGEPFFFVSTFDNKLGWGFWRRRRSWIRFLSPLPPTAFLIVYLARLYLRTFVRLRSCLYLYNPERCTQWLPLLFFAWQKGCEVGLAEGEWLAQNHPAILQAWGKTRSHHRPVSSSAPSHIIPTWLGHYRILFFLP